MDNNERLQNYIDLMRDLAPDDYEDEHITRYYNEYELPQECKQCIKNGLDNCECCSEYQLEKYLHGDDEDETDDEDENIY